MCVCVCACVCMCMHTCVAWAVHGDVVVVGLFVAPVERRGSAWGPCGWSVGTCARVLMLTSPSPFQSQAFGALVGPTCAARGSSAWLWRASICQPLRPNREWGPRSARPSYKYIAFDTLPDAMGASRCTPALGHTPCSIGMSRMADYTCCSSVAFDRPNEDTSPFTFGRVGLCGCRPLFTQGVPSL